HVVLADGDTAVHDGVGRRGTGLGQARDRAPGDLLRLRDAGLQRGVAHPLAADLLAHQVEHDVDRVGHRVLDRARIGTRVTVGVLDGDALDLLALRVEDRVQPDL